jgi:hypothetical protein
MPDSAPIVPGAPDATAMAGGRRRSGATVKTMKRALKKAGLKVSGKKATLTRRVKKAHLKVGGAGTEGAVATGEEEKTGAMDAGRRRRRSSRKH